MVSIKKNLITGFLFFLLFLTASSQNTESLIDYKQKGDIAFNNHHHKKAFEYYSEYLLNNPNDTFYVEKAALSGFYCQRNNTINGQIAELTPFYYKYLTSKYGKAEYYKDQAKSNFYSGLYFTNEIPYKAAEYYLQSLKSLDSVSLDSDSVNELNGFFLEVFNCYRNSLVYSIRNEAYNKFVDDVSDFMKSDKTDDKASLTLLLKLNVLNGYLESENPLIFEGEHHFVNKTIEDIQQILKEFDEEVIREHFSPICFFVFNNFQAKDEITTFRINQAKGIKTIADERKIKTPSEQEKLIFWEEYSKKQQQKKRDLLIKIYGEQIGSMLSNKQFPPKATTDMVRDILGEPVLTRNYLFKKGKITIFLYQNQEMYVFLNNELHITQQ